jgi:ribosomal protein S21
MSYEREQRIIQQEFFKCMCGGRFGKQEYPFVLKEEYRKQNLFDQISDEAINYFKLNNIGWWRGINGLPTNHTLSSQISCVNHLFWLKDNFKAATATLQEIDPYFTALPFENGNYVEFELNGCDENHNYNYLGERSSTRGANTTSIDACMLAKKDNEKTLVFIEWKYVEKYYEKPWKAKQKKSYEVRKKTYKQLLESRSCPIILNHRINNNSCDYDADYLKFSVEPFYQLMRQTLLAWQLVQNNRYGVTDYIHIHVIPDGNDILLQGKTSPEITDDSTNICEAWSKFLKNPEKYKHISPNSLLKNSAFEYNKVLYDYLNKRYWN